jgi:serine/threonine protein kinase
MFPREPLPSRIGPYRIVRRLSSRRGADLYLGVHEGPMDFTRECVLKLVPAPGSAGDPRSAEELAQEARVCSRLNHPAIVRMHDFFEHGEHLVLVFEHFAGVSLARLLSHLRRRKQQLGDDAIWYIAHALFSALQHAHSLTDERGASTPVIHRDVQPAHVVMSADAQVRLAGFGIAKIAGTESNTAVGFVKGTPAYMAPEQARGEKVTERVDVFAAGLVVWEMLTGRSVVPGPGAGQGAELLALVGGRRVEPLSSLRRDLPRELVAAIDACLEFSPTKRQIRCSDVVRWIDKLVDLNLGRSDLRERLVQARNAALRAPPSSTSTPRNSMPPSASSAPRGAASRFPGLATRMTGRAGDGSEGDPAPRSTRRVPPVMAPPSSRPPAAAELTVDDAIEAVRSPVPAAGRPPSLPSRADGSTHAKGTLLGLAPTSTQHQPVVDAAATSVPAMPPLPTIDQSAEAVADMRPPPGVHLAPPPQPPHRAPAAVVISHMEPGERLSPGDTTVLTRRSWMFQRGSRVWGFIGLAATVAITAAVTAVVVVRLTAGSRVEAPRGSAETAPRAAATAPSASVATPSAAAESPAVSAAASVAPVASATDKPIPRGLGVLIVRSPPEGTVYVSGVPLGETNERLELACGRQKFVRVGTRPGPGGLVNTTWLTPGQSVMIRCREAVEIAAMPRYPVQ